MVKTIDITIFSDGLSNKNVIDAGVQGDDNTTALNVTVDSGALPTVADGETLKIFAECVNGAGEYYISDFLELNDNTIYFPLPIEITRGGGMASLHFVFSVLSVSNEQLRASVTSEIKLRFEDSVQFYQSEYLDAMSSTLANLYEYRGKFADLQSQIDTIDDVKVPELQTDIETLKTDVSNLQSVDTTVADHIGRLITADENLQSQIDNLGGVDVSELQTDINHLQEKVNVMNGDIGDWIGNDTVYQAVTKLQTKDTDLQSQIDTKVTREVAVVGSDDENSAGWYKVADGTMPNLNDVSMLFAVHSTVTNKQYAGILQLNLRSDASGNITCPQLGWLLRNGFEDGQVIVTTDGLNWAMYFKVTSPRYYRTFFEVLQKSDRINSALKNYNLYTNSTVETTAPTATFASTDLGTVHQAIADLTARIEALENSAS